jgi:rod shape-determining protein MreC
MPLLAPLQGLVVRSIDALGNVGQRTYGLWQAQVDNQALRQQISRLRAELAANEEIRQENLRLHQLLRIKERAEPLDLLVAQVISTTSTPLFRSVRLDRGRADGLELGAAVLHQDGLVGRVALLGESYADVLLLVDSNSSADVLVQRSRARARLRGQGGDSSLGLEVQYLARTAEVQPGDVLITSGLGNSFPKGLRVGRVTAVSQRAFGLYQQATVEPAVDFHRLETLLVVRRPADSSLSLEVAEASGAAP